MPSYHHLQVFVSGVEKAQAAIISGGHPSAYFRSKELSNTRVSSARESDYQRNPRKLSFSPKAKHTFQLPYYSLLNPFGSPQQPSTPSTFSRTNTNVNTRRVAICIRPAPTLSRTAIPDPRLSVHKSGAPVRASAPSTETHTTPHVHALHNLQRSGLRAVATLVWKAVRVVCSTLIRCSILTMEEVGKVGTQRSTWSAIHRTTWNAMQRAPCKSLLLRLVLQATRV